MNKKTFLSVLLTTTSSLAMAQANFWNLNSSYMDTRTETAGVLSSTSMPHYLYESEASSFAVPGLCETYCKLSFGSPGRASYIVINHVTEGYAPALPGFISGNKDISAGIGTVYTDNASYAAGKLESNGDRALYARNGNVIYRLCYLRPDGTTLGSPVVLYTAPGISGFEFDNWTAMEVSPDGKFLLMVGKDAKYLVALNLDNLTTFTYNSPGGANGRIQGFEYVKISATVPIRIYISYNSKNAANPSGNGGVGFYTLMDPSTFYSVSPPSGTTATDFGFSEIEQGKNGRLFLARNTSGSYDFSGAGTVYSLDIFGNWRATGFSVPASDNTSYAAYCDKYYIQTQIDGEDYDAGYYNVPAVVSGTTSLKFKFGSTVPATAPTIFRCDSEPLVLKTTISELMKTYTIKVTSGLITGGVFNPGVLGNVSHTGTGSGTTIELPLMPFSFVPASFVGTDWKVEITPKNACGIAGATETLYFTVKPMSALSEYKKATKAGSDTTAIQRTLPITTPAPAINPTLALFRANVDAARGWMGAGTAGIKDIKATGDWSLSVYEVEDITGIRKVRSGITAPTIVSLAGAGDMDDYVRFNDYSIGFDAFNPPFFTGSPGNGLYFIDFYRDAFAKSTLSDFSGRIYCVELQVTEPVSGCTATTKSYFRIANNGPYTNGASARPTDINNTKEEAALNIYPNPANTTFTITMPAGTEHATLRLMDYTGRKVQENNDLKSGNNDINIRHLPSGAYFYEILIDHKLQHGKLIKQ